MKIFLSLFVFSLFLFPSFAFAEVGCRCFCGTEQGALTPSGGESVSFANCETLCEKADQKVVVCATDPAQYPVNFFRCFTREDCSSQCKERSDPSDPDTCFFGSEQPKSCIPGQHYCYRNDKPYTLAYGIPTEEGVAAPTGQKVVNVGEYINLVYKFLLWGGVIIAIVMIMIGGFKMVLSAATDRVKGGKEQIRNAIIGLVILLASGLILQTVNPQLLSLTPPKLPMLKLVTFLGEGQSCEEQFKSGKVEIDKTVPADKQEKKSNFGSKQCGSIVAIRAKEGKPAIPAGSTCTYTECPSTDPKTGKSISSDAKCIPNGDKSLCLSCGELNADLEDGIPSVSSCGKLKKPDPPDQKLDAPAVGTVPVERNFCFYSHHPSLIISNWDAAKYTAMFTAAGVGGFYTGLVPLAALISTGAIASDVAPKVIKGTCAELSLNCAEVRQAGCKGYDNKRAKNKITGNELNDLSTSSTYGSVNLGTICAQDPCKVGKPGDPCRLATVGDKITCTSNAREQEGKASEASELDWKKTK